MTKEPADSAESTASPFRVDLRGVVDLLARHLYSSSAVFVRELIQNAVDAIHARQLRGLGYKGAVTFEVDEETHTLTVIDNGIGLTRDQIDDFLACVGASSKIDELDTDDRDTFIGQFGIGVLSTFMVADEVILLTRSIEPKSPSLEWRGATDGTYSVRELDSRLEPGTRVILKIRNDSAEFAEGPRIGGLVQLYGGCLDIPITIERVGEVERDANWDPYTHLHSWIASNQPRLWETGDHVADDVIHQLVGFEPLDQFAIVAPELGLEAMAYVSPEPAPRSSLGLHRLYLKGIFVTDHSVHVVPPWASFVRLVINSTQLNPTASRESVREDDIFEKTRDFIATAVRAYLHRLGARSSGPSDALRRFLSVHDSAVRSVATEDDDFCRAIIDLLPFETSLGTITFGQHRADNTVVRVAPTLDQFRSCSAMAAAQGVTIFNGGYTDHAELLERAVALDTTGELSLESVSVRQLIEGMSRADAKENARFGPLVEVAKTTLAPLGCAVRLGSFEPEDVAAVFAEGAEQSLARLLGSARSGPPQPVWDEILDSLDQEIDEEAKGAFICLNARAPLLDTLRSVDDPEVLAATLRVLYVQALLLGRQPLTTEETTMFGESLQIVLTKGTFSSGEPA